MTDNFKTDAPTLTFEPFGAETKEEVAAAQTNKLTIEQEYETYPLSDEEKKSSMTLPHRLTFITASLSCSMAQAPRKKYLIFQNRRLKT